MVKTKVISGFPGIGKSHFKNEVGGKVLDSDSSLFSWESEGVRHPDFPNNYIKHIQENIGKADIILVSSHDNVRKALVDAGIEFTLVYPSRHLKEEYMYRYIMRQSPEGFITLMHNKWDDFMDELDLQLNCDKIILSEGKYLSDCIPALK
jgi:hypothetical protein